ncbi:MAG: universal stress protein [Solirubrobacteraceae bacterium]
MFQRILLAWDGSDLALHAFDVAIDVCRRYEAELVAVSIAHSPAHAETDEDRRQTADAARRYLSSTFEEVADRAQRAGIDVEHVIIEGDAPTHALAGYAHQHGFDLIVCGHHHARRAGRLLLAGVAQDLLEATTTPVLVISDELR